MSLSTYAGLIARIGDDLERDDTAALAPDWIVLAEARFNRELRVHQMLKRGTATLNAEFGTQPLDFAGPMSMRLTSGSKRLLQFKTPEQMANYVAQRPSGETDSYGIVGDEFWFSPVPVLNADLTGENVELIYYGKIPPLSPTNTTNWLLTAYPDVYLRGALVEAALYYRDPDRLSTQQALFTDAVQRVEAAAKKDMLSANLNPSPSGFVV